MLENYSPPMVTTPGLLVGLQAKMDQSTTLLSLASRVEDRMPLISTPTWASRRINDPPQASTLRQQRRQKLACVAVQKTPRVGTCESYSFSVFSLPCALASPSGTSTVCFTPSQPPGTVTSRRREREHVAGSPVLTELRLGRKNWALSERAKETW